MRSQSIIQRPLPYFDERPAGMPVDTIVIHSMYEPSAADPLSIDACIALLDKNKVAPHYSITRAGLMYQSVDEAARAWQAGASRMPFADDARENVNHFSIGIELIAAPETDFTPEQYAACAGLCRDIIGRHPICNIIGHEHIAPGRKVDPGGHFDWKRFRRALARRRVAVGRIRFPGS